MNHSRRSLLKFAAAAPWLTPLAHCLAAESERQPSGQPAKSVILLWMAGGPSQLETFDPHPDKEISGGTRAIKTAVDGIQLAEGLPQLAERMADFSIVRSVKSTEGDHERGTYMVKTGYRPDPTAVHPSIGAVCCHELPEGKTEIPRHISILPGQRPGRGGFLGDQYDAFKAFDPVRKLPDMTSRVSEPRTKERLADLDVLERTFARGRERQATSTLHVSTVQSARTMMTSEQLKAFDTSLESSAIRAAYGDTPFGRGCLAARRLVEVGVRCVEVTLDGWDTHINNHELVARNNAILDPAMAALIADLQKHNLWNDTIVLCAGEFGRTPKINGAGGRDHWSHGFSVAIGGGRVRGGQALGETDPEGSKQTVDPRQVGDIHATVYAALGLDPKKENISPVGRPLKLAEGEPIAQLLT